MNPWPWIPTTFDAPQHLAWLAVVPVVWWAFVRRTALRRADATTFTPGAPTTSASPNGAIVLSLALVACGLAAAMPGCSATRASAEADPGVVIVVDVSMSMKASDVVPSRLDAAKTRLAAILPELAGIRVGVVAAAGQPVVVCPLTRDREAVAQVLGEIDEFSAPAGGSRLGLALTRARRALAGGIAGSQVIVVTDGEVVGETPAEVLAAAAELRRAGARVDVVGVGTALGAPVPKRSLTSAPALDAGRVDVVRSVLDAQFLTELSGGMPWVPLDGRETPDALAALQRSAPASGTEARVLRPFGPQSWYGVPLALALACFVIDAWRGLRSREARP